MEIVRRVRAMREITARARSRGLRIGFVPTMGSLHEGHLSLIRETKHHADILVVSIFVNPTQFDDAGDFEDYPRNIERDADLCIAEGVDYLFTPDAEEMYPEGPATHVVVETLSDSFEGASRPGHFRGVATVVAKLLHAVRPHLLTLGQKDAQQVAVLRRMVQDLFFDVEILAVPIVRADDGVALSSRLRHLDGEQREAARGTAAAMDAAREALLGSGGDPRPALDAAREVIEAQPMLEVDYLALVDPDTLMPLDSVEGEGLLLMAVFCGKIRLLDNARLQSLGAREE